MTDFLIIYTITAFACFISWMIGEADARNRDEHVGPWVTALAWPLGVVIYVIFTVIYLLQALAGAVVTALYWTRGR